MKSLFVAALFGLGLLTPALADPSGTYSVSGDNPDQDGSYEGTVTLTKTGDTYKVVWRIGNHTVAGTAVGNDRFLSIGYASGTKPGVGLYVRENGQWKGVWSYLGQTSVGSELWSQ